jgi:hypothetical protein
MPSFFVSIAFSFIAWSVVAARYIWPELRLQPRAAALRPLLILHRFSRCFLWHHCQVGQALLSHGCSIFGAQPIF